MSKLIVCEKRNQGLIIQPFLNEGDVIIICLSISSYQFKYPKNLKFEDVPYISRQPIYNKNIFKNDDEKKSIYAINHHKNKITKDSVDISNEIYDFSILKSQNNNSDEFIASKNKLHDYILSFDEIIYCCDFDHTGVRAFNFLFEKTFEFENFEKTTLEKNIKVKSCLNFYIYTKDDFDNEINKSVSYFEDLHMQNLKNIYLKKDYFDYNYNLNSILLLNKAYSYVFNNNPTKTINKNILQTLFLVSENDYKTGSLHFHMNKKHIGSPASRNEIIKNLLELKIFDNKNGFFFITEKGFDFLSLLHKKLNDPHLNKRLYDDYSKKLSFDVFKNKYDKYLESSFGKQKRFLNKKDI